MDEIYAEIKEIVSTGEKLTASMLKNFLWEHPAAEEICRIL